MRYSTSTEFYYVAVAHCMLLQFHKSTTFLIVKHSSTGSVPEKQENSSLLDIWNADVPLLCLSLCISVSGILLAVICRCSPLKL